MASTLASRRLVVRVSDTRPRDVELRVRGVGIASCRAPAGTGRALDAVRARPRGVRLSRDGRVRAESWPMHRRVETSGMIGARARRPMIVAGARAEIGGNLSRRRAARPRRNSSWSGRSGRRRPSGAARPPFCMRALVQRYFTSSTAGCGGKQLLPGPGEHELAVGARVLLLGDQAPPRPAPRRPS